MDIKFDGEPVYGDINKYINTKIKIYDGNVNTNFQGKKVPKQNASYNCLSLLMLDSVVQVKKKYYPQTLLEEWKYETKKTKMENLSNDEVEASSSDVALIMMNLNLTTKKRMLSLMNNLLKVKKVF